MKSTYQIGKQYMKEVLYWWPHLPCQEYHSLALLTAFNHKLTMISLFLYRTASYGSKSSTVAFFSFLKMFLFLFYVMFLLHCYLVPTPSICPYVHIFTDFYRLYFPDYKSRFFSSLAGPATYMSKNIHDNNRASSTLTTTEHYHRKNHKSKP